MYRTSQALAADFEIFDLTQSAIQSIDQLTNRCDVSALLGQLSLSIAFQVELSLATIDAKDLQE